jgi:hypothetical protein
MELDEQSQMGYSSGSFEYLILNEISIGYTKFMGKYFLDRLLLKQAVFA